jgi:TolB-like protein
VVLPFDNMSPDPSDAYLGDGLTEELTTKLSKLGSLRVISRNSAMALKGKKKDTRAITRELDVQYVLEGSVRKAGDALRITAQLIDGERDAHLWADTYSGTVEDVFGMQEKVSLAIVDALRVELSSEETRRLQERPFQSFQAYQFYIRAMADAWGLSDTSLARALETAELGLATVGENDLLLVVKGWVFFQYVNMMVRPPDTYSAFIEEAQRCADRALELNPQSAGAHGLQSCVYAATGKLRQGSSARPQQPRGTNVGGVLACGGRVGHEGSAEHPGASGASGSADGDQRRGQRLARVVRG